MQDEKSAVSDRLCQLQDKICEDALTVINCCESHDELDFLFPEITRIYNHDLAVLDSWQHHIDWTASLPISELKLLSSDDFNNYEFINTSEDNSIAPLEPEVLNVKKKPIKIAQNMIDFGRRTKIS